jgi:hypothetical protein
MVTAISFAASFMVAVFGLTQDLDHPTIEARTATPILAQGDILG